MRYDFLELKDIFQYVRSLTFRMFSTRYSRLVAEVKRLLLPCCLWLLSDRHIDKVIGCVVCVLTERPLLFGACPTSNADLRERRNESRAKDCRATPRLQTGVLCSRKSKL
jgi:hypothetical protein